MSSENALAELRLTTRAEHERVERILQWGEPMPLARYGAILCGFDAFLRTWEPRLHAALPVRLQAWFRARRRGGLASADVEWLRAVAGLAPVALRADRASTLTLADPAEAMGSLYVIEALGVDARAAAARLQRPLGVGPGRGASFLHGFGGETATMWDNFRMQAALEIGDSPRNTARACDSARRTLAALVDLFAPLAPPEAAAVPDEPPNRIAPALLRVYGAAGGEPPLADIPIDLPAEDDSEDVPTLVELPIDAGEDEGGDTQRVPL